MPEATYSTTTTMPELKSEQTYNVSAMCTQKSTLKTMGGGKSDGNNDHSRLR